MTVLLEVKGLEVSYGHIAAVKGIDFALNAGEITSLVGANGAGKSTTLLALSGLIPKSQGEVRGQILFEGADVTQWSAHKRVERGIVQVAEGRATLTTMTVRENLEPGRLYAERPQPNRLGSGARVPPVPAPEGAHRRHGRQPVGRRAADARHRPGADGAAARAAAR